ncbi:uncharacterized protein TNCT_571551 [Trichonephila clavata]|uniref:Uncharacterized protein n=1 Tax=Trichonephila clavata TaxID=2740835 RepID=A0A8X6K899_TRICU|nr:uncharacterized protein TNCT_571551 [Trichonephila clavata]
MHSSNCFFSIEEVFDLKLKPLVDKSDYEDLAVCFDNNSPHISDCVPKKWIATNTLIDAHFTSKLCRAGDAFLSCVRKMIQKKCSKLESMFSSIEQSLYQIFFPQCSKLSELSSLKISVTSDKNFNEVYNHPTTTQVSTDLQKNSSTVIVHQHMVINVNHYEINIAIKNRAILILIAILFCSHFLYNMNIM